MTKDLAIETEAGHRPATDEEILAAAGRIASARRKRRRGGRPPVLSPSKQVRAIEMLDAGKSQKEVAKALGCAQSTISRIWRGER